VLYVVFIIYVTCNHELNVAVIEDMNSVKSRPKRTHQILSEETPKGIVLMTEFGADA